MLVRITKKRKKSLYSIKQLKTTLKSCFEISSRLEIKELVPQIMNSFLAAAQTDKALLMLYDQKANRLKLEASRGVEIKEKNLKLKIGEGIPGKAAEKQNPVFVNSENIERYQSLFSQNLGLFGEESVLSIPFIFRERLFGVISLYGKKSGEKDILSQIAYQAAVSIRNSLMYRAAVTERITGFYIKRHFTHCLEQEIDKAQRYNRDLSLLFIDIDHFKKFNKTYGRKIGDRAVFYLSEAIKNSIRFSDLAGRWDADEIMIILPETGLKKARLIARRLKKEIEKKSFQARGREYKIKVSMGIGEYRAKMTSAQELIKEAQKDFKERAEKKTFS
ncbi:MAG: diguanylate cyclase [Elusimicrobiota bacterium]